MKILTRRAAASTGLGLAAAASIIPLLTQMYQDNYPEEMNEELLDSLAAILFNAHGMMYEVLKNSPSPKHI